MERIFHRYDLWECYKDGFYDNCENKEEMICNVFELFENPKLTERYMNLVIEKWKYSCEHNLTNISLNRIAWLGQAACCLYAKIPYRITMENWRYIPLEFREIANNIADSIVNNYCKKYA